ncbi:hypothetical protein BDF22DRAFT_657508 [Syncephalis plumigaleata]|nr:hypothetical protein BDF22DRAFT_657508 [Syncephalis plumigaleata]
MESSADNNNNNSQPIVNAATSISSNSTGISIIIIIDTSQHANHAEADEEHWIYIYKDTAMDYRLLDIAVGQNSDYNIRRTNRKLVCNHICLNVTERRQRTKRRISKQVKDIIK